MPSAPPPPRGAVEPLTQELARYHVTVPARVLEKLEAARAALSHVKPGASDAEVLEAALDELLDKAAKRKVLAEAGAVGAPVTAGQRTEARREATRR